MDIFYVFYHSEFMKYFLFSKNITSQPTEHINFLKISLKFYTFVIQLIQIFKFFFV